MSCRMYLPRYGIRWLCFRHELNLASTLNDYVLYVFIARHKCHFLSPATKSLPLTSLPLLATVNCYQCFVWSIRNIYDWHSKWYFSSCFRLTYWKIICFSNIWLRWIFIYVIPMTNIINWAQKWAKHKVINYFQDEILA